MKKITLLLLLFCSVKLFGQGTPFPINATNGTATSTVLTRGISAADSAYWYRTAFTDTAAANRGRIDEIPGAVIRTIDNKLWLRNNAATAWGEIGSGSSVNIYNTNGTLTGNRVLTGTNTYRLAFEGLTSGRIEANNGAGNTGLLYVDTDTILLNGRTANKFRVNGTLKMYMDGTGVGVGTASPAATLHVAGSSGSTLRIVDGNQGANRLLISDADGDASWSSTLPSAFTPLQTIQGAYILNWQTTPRVYTGVTVASDSLISGTGSAYAGIDYRNTASNEWEQEIIFSPTSTISGTVAINITLNSLLGVGSCIGSINLGTSTISITNGGPLYGSAWTQTSSVTAVSAGDVIRMRIIFYHNTLNFLYENVTKNQVINLNKIRPFGYLSGSGLNDIGHADGTPGITFSGVASIKIFDWKFKDNTRGQVAWVGHSVAEGYSASAWNKTYVYKVDSMSSTKVALYAKNGMTIYDLVVNRTIDNIILSSPSVVVMDGLWFNDGTAGQSLANTFTRMRFIRDRLAAHNIPVIWLGSAVPSAFTTSINDSIQAVYPNDPFWNLPAFLSGSYLSPDGAHPNDLGHQEIADSLYIRLPFITGTSYSYGLAPPINVLAASTRANTITVGHSQVWNYNGITTGIGHSFNSNSITSGTILNITGTSTALAANNEGLNIGISGANGTNGITATGARISVTNTNGTSGTNIGAAITASGATTANYSLDLTGAVRHNGTSSGAVTITPAAAAGTWTLTLPTTDGNSGEFLQTNGSGVTTWAAAGGGGSVIPSTYDFRITTESGVPVSTTDRTSQGTIYMTPYIGNHISLYFDAVWGDYTTAEISLALTVTSGKNYDVFAYTDGADVFLELSDAWTNDNTRDDALTRQDGVIVKSGATDRRWVGTIRASGTNVTEDSQGGTTTQVGGKRFVWNAYNQVRRAMKVVDLTDNWNYATGTWRQANGASGNQVEYVTGDASMLLDVLLNSAVNLSGTSARGANNGVGISSTSAPSGFNAIGYNVGGSMSQPMIASYTGTPGLGYFYVTWLEYGSDGGCLWYGNNGRDDVGMKAVITN